ncbi:nucleotide-binding protein, putative [Eimeria necatrix]|uniref:Nucleotide-binding protein, putative n=1 Tax=Eimeria necatrix TaxID=51315 RepID=U6MGT5_9EIME|nr:nucleotide-binding protein, putative [Eimeria necatrix]CDJ62273.1 nucleotide-binding protein, putative [Eimeria necatrix]
MAGLSRGSVAALCAASAAAGAAAAAAVLLLCRCQQQQQQQQQRQQQQQQQQQQQDISESCPGPESQMAGLAAGCEGCPGRSLCLAAKGGAAAAAAASAAAEPEAAAAADAAKQQQQQQQQPKSPEVAQKLKNVKKKIIILSGKGGVGKSTVASQLGSGIGGLGRKVKLPVLGVVENMAESLFAEGPHKGGAQPQHVPLEVYRHPKCPGDAATAVAAAAAATAAATAAAARSRRRHHS